MKKRLPVLMYHSVNKSVSNGLTISKQHIETQFQWIKEQNYQPIKIGDLLSNTYKRPILITFDDAYVDFLELAYPLLIKYGLKATLFVPFAFLGKYDEWNKGKSPIMTVEDLKLLDPSVVQLGWHSYNHPNYKYASTEAISLDLKKAQEVIVQNNLIVEPALAYPYGAYPKHKMGNFVKILQEFKIEYGFRIGNRLNAYPIHKPYTIQRLDVKGEIDFNDFKLLLKYGKLYPYLRGWF